MQRDRRHTAPSAVQTYSQCGRRHTPSVVDDVLIPGVVGDILTPSMVGDILPVWYNILPVWFDILPVWFDTLQCGTRLC